MAAEARAWQFLSEGGDGREGRRVQIEGGDETELIDMIYRAETTKGRGAPSKRHSGHVRCMPKRWSPRAQMSTMHSGDQNVVWLKDLAPQDTVEVTDQRNRPKVDGKSHWKLTVSTV
jgi:hypothetical protein